MNSKKHKHHHAGKSSRNIISASKVFNLLDLTQEIIFSGCRLRRWIFLHRGNFKIRKGSVFSLKE